MSRIFIVDTREGKCCVTETDKPVDYLRYGVFEFCQIGTSDTYTCRGESGTGVHYVENVNVVCSNTTVTCRTRYVQAFIEMVRAAYDVRMKENRVLIYRDTNRLWYPFAG